MHKRRYLFGNLLILLSLSLLAFTYWPLVQFFIPVKATADTVNTGFYIKIPKINAAAPVIANVDPLNKTDYMQALQKGIAQAKGSSLPDQNGTIYLFAHSSLPPWEITRTNTAFLRLGELQAGDKITINYVGREYNYVVSDKKELWPNETEYLTKQSGNKLILQTCTPIGTSLKRLLIFAQPVKRLDTSTF